MLIPTNEDIVIRPLDTSTFLMDGQAIGPAAHYIRDFEHHCHPETYATATLLESPLHLTQEKATKLNQFAPNRSKTPPDSSSRSDFDRSCLIKVLEKILLLSSHPSGGRTLCRKRPWMIDVNEKRNHRGCFSLNLEMHMFQNLLASAGFFFVFVFVFFASSAWC
jgi:hypothetical protein